MSNAIMSGFITVSSGCIKLPEEVGLWLSGCTVVGPGGELRLNGKGQSSQSVHECIIESGGYLYAGGNLARVTSATVQESGRLFVNDDARLCDVMCGGLMVCRGASNILHMEVTAGGKALLEDVKCANGVHVHPRAELEVSSQTHIEHLVVRMGGYARISESHAVDVEICSGGTLSILDANVSEIRQSEGAVVKINGKCKVHYNRLSEVGGPEFKEYSDGLSKDE